MLIFRYIRKPQPHRNRKSMETIDDFQAGIIKQQRERHGQATVIDVAKAVGKTPQTFFYYFSNIPGAMRELDRAVKSELREYMRGGKFRGSDNEINRDIFTICFDVMSQRGKVFYQLCLHNHRSEYIHSILKILYKYIKLPNTTLQRKPKPSDPRVETYLWCMVCVYQRWGKETKCNIKKTDSYMKRLLNLTADAAIKLR